LVRPFGPGCFFVAAKIAAACPHRDASKSEIRISKFETNSNDQNSKFKTDGVLGHFNGVREDVLNI